MREFFPHDMGGIISQFSVTSFSIDRLTGIARVVVRVEWSIPVAIFERFEVVDIPWRITIFACAPDGQIIYEVSNIIPFAPPTVTTGADTDERRYVYLVEFELDTPIARPFPELEVTIRQDQTGVFKSPRADVTGYAAEPEIDAVLENEFPAVAEWLRASERPLTEFTKEIETDRLTDLVLHRGFYYRGDAVETSHVLAANEALEPHGEYTLEVAIRRVLKGVESAGPETPVRNPRKGREDITVYAVVECRQPNAPDFKDAMLDLTWPFERDSTPAFFRFETGPALPPEPLKIEVRLYAEAGLQLLDLLELTWASRQWMKVRPDAGPAAMAAPASGAVQNAVTFHITGAPDGFGIKAVFKRNGKVHLVAPLGRAIQAPDLEDLLLRVRNYWTRLVIGKMSTRRHLSEGGYAEALKDLFELGGMAWRKLFGDRRGVLQGTPEALGELMQDAPLPPDSPMRVTLAGDAETFVFPWAILCPPLRRKEAPDPHAMWGLRYMIELTRKNDPDPFHREDGGHVRIATTVDPGFAGSVDHSATLARIAALRPGAELLDGNSEDIVLDRLEAVPPADIYYYFCHGISPGRGGSLNPEVVAEMEKTLESLSQAERKPWETLLRRMKSNPVEAFMFTGAAEITEYELRKAEFFHGRRPIVFLNMCHSADLLPLMRKGLTHVFIDRQAIAVLGTECPVTSIFADMFAEQILTGLLTGQTIGEAVLNARRHFHADCNPLGLLYTLYGHGDARVTAPSATYTEKD